MKKKILIPVIAGVLVIIGLVLFLVFTSDDSYYSIKILETKGTVSIDRDKKSINAEKGLKMCDKDYITELDVSHNTKLVNLICSSTNITKLDVSMLPDLEELRAGFTKLTTLDLSKNPKLKALNIMYGEIKEVDLRNNPNITTLYVDGGCNVIK